MSETKELMDLVRSSVMKKVLASELEPKVDSTSLSQLILPLWHQRELYKQLLVSSPERAAIYFKTHARTADKLVHPPETELKPMTRAEINAAFERTKKRTTENNKPLNRRV